MADELHVSPQSDSQPAGDAVLRLAFLRELPVVLFLGQASGWSDTPDPVLAAGLQKAGRTGTDWRALLSREPLSETFFEWLGERFLNRGPSQELLLIADGPFSAVYTSSVDPTLVNLFSTDGRLPEPIILGDPPPPIRRSRRRLPIYYLFGRAGAGIAGFVPPRTSQLLSQRRLQHASPMLRTINEAATPLGLIVVDGYRPDRDWLRPDELLAVLSSAPVCGVLWCGSEPQFDEENQETYAGLVRDGILVRDHRPLGRLIESAADALGLQTFDAMRYREMRLKELRNLAGLFEGRQHAVRAMSSAIYRDLERTFGMLQVDADRHELGVSK